MNLRMGRNTSCRTKVEIDLDEGVVVVAEVRLSRRCRREGCR
jgi:hypothetical protein